MNGLIVQFLIAVFFAFSFIIGVVAVRYFAISNSGESWCYKVAAVGLLMIIVFPHGWEAVFGEAWQEKHAIVKHSALFMADFLGVVVVATIACTCLAFLTARRCT